MAQILHRDDIETDDRLAQEKFLLATQAEIQMLMSRKKLRHRDLSKRLGVSEARVSQMLGDDGANLTIRTIARIYFCLEETPMILSRPIGATHSGDEAGLDVVDDEMDWHVLAADLEHFQVTNAQPCNDTEIAHGFRSPNRDWISAAHASRRRA